MDSKCSEKGDVSLAFNEARLIHQSGNLRHAEALYQSILHRCPNHADALQMLGILALQSGYADTAVAWISRALAVAPTPLMHINRAVALTKLDRLDEAINDYTAAVEMEPASEEARKRLAGVFHRLERWEEAIRVYSDAICLWPRATWPLIGRGDALRSLGAYDEALSDYDLALRLDARLPAAHVGRGSVFSDQLRHYDALRAFDTALALDSGLALAHLNRSITLRKMGRLSAATTAAEASVLRQPEFAIAHMHLAVCYLQQGRIQAGFEEYEWRKLTPDFVEPRYQLPSTWNGEEIEGRTLYIYPERFLGDMIQFSRYALLAHQRGARVILASKTSLHPLLQTLSPSIELISDAEVPSRYHYQTALLSLPRAFRGLIPAFDRYLHAETARMAMWRHTIGTNGFKIGVCWHGSSQAYATSLHRSFPLALLARLNEIRDVRLISLQKHDGLDQLAELPRDLTIETFQNLDDGESAFLDTAAIIATCDLVITADTAVAHLAGALGARVWVALPRLAEWRWMEERSDSPWYPSMRLFRQPIQGDWTSVFDAMANALEDA